VQNLRVKYWEKIKKIEAHNLVFLDETGIMLGLARTHARSQVGTRVGGIKPYYRGHKVTVIGAVSLKKVLAVMTMNDSMDGAAFAVFIEKFLCPQLWPGAVVVMDNLPAHKLTSIVPMIESVGASVICLSPYSPDFNPIEMWWSQLKSFLRSFAPKTSAIIDRIIAVAINLMDTNHLRHWFTHCCYCTS
jgi:putative transposase